MPLFDMKDWIISIVAVVLITSILSLILPQGKMGKYIKNIFSLLTMFVMIKPIIYVKEGNFNYEQIIGANEIVLQDGFLEFVYNKRIEEYEENCNKIIEEIGVKGAGVNINFNINKNQDIDIYSVQINLKNSVIILDKPHINIKEEIIADIASCLNVNKDLVMIYE